MDFYVCFDLDRQDWVILGIPNDSGIAPPVTAIRVYDNLTDAKTMGTLLNTCPAASEIAVMELVSGIVSDAIAFGEAIEVTL